VRFTVDAEFESAIECNCSHCAMQGALLVFVPKERFTLTAGEEKLRDYRFNKKVIAHLFCTECGIEPFGRGTGPDGTEMVAINVRCLDDIDLGAIARTPFDGKKM
jgi:hypothetical protein